MRHMLQMLVFLSWRSLWSHKGRNLIVGALMFFGTVVVAAGSALIDSLERTMSDSIISSVAGHLQVYSGNARDSLSLFGGMMMSRDEIGFIPDFERVRRELSLVPNVETVVPQALDTAQVVGGNDFDRLLESFRQAHGAGDAVLVKEIASVMRASVAELRKDLEQQFAVSVPTAEDRQVLADFQAATEEGFWSDFFKRVDEKIDFLDTRIARHADQFEMPMYVRYLATDPDVFARSFSKFELVAGTMIPKGERGFLFNKRFHDEVFRNRVIHRLEKIRTGLAEGRTLKDDPKLRAHVEKNVKEYMRVLMRIRPGKLEALDQALAAARREFAGDRLLLQASDRGGMLRALLTMDDANVMPRMRFFDEKIRPLMREYELTVGDSLDIRSFTRSGYMRSVQVKIFGVFRFKGIDQSDVSGSHNLVDLATFRDLYGFMSEEGRQEMEGMKAAAGVQDIARENAEAELFGGEAPAEVKTTIRSESLVGGNANPVLNAAIILKDPTRLEETRLAIEARAAELNLKVETWQGAAGIVGQFVAIVRAVLVAASIMVFLAALAIINNSMIISTMERITEIGTMRAIGTQRAFVLALFVCETLMLGLLVGLLGVWCAAALVSLLGKVGIPAGSDQLAFLFGGERLFPTFSLMNLCTGLGSVLVVSILAALYPAMVAARIPPVVALQAKE